MDEHFAELFARYEGLGPHRAVQQAARQHVAIGDSAPELALAHSAAVGT
jgi:hypothetical protein